MRTYVTLLNFTSEGIRTLKETIQRADDAAERAQKYGGSLQTYWTVGPYDLVAIFEAPDDEITRLPFLTIRPGYCTGRG
jgi:uncharacterized protein with GYD domain